MKSPLKRLLPKKLLDVLRTIIGPIVKDPWMMDRLHREEFFRRAFSALSFNGIDGDYAEFGCHGGVTFSLAYRESRRSGHRCKLWAFDSFQGLPPQQLPEDSHPEWVAGAMKTSVDAFRRICQSNGIPSDVYKVVPGYFEETIGKAPGTDAPGNICLAYIDCDLYSSTKTVLQFLLPRLKHGMILAFDDYYNYSADQLAGERRACLECFPTDSRWVLVPYQQIGWFGMSFIVESRTLHVAPTAQPPERLP